MVAPAGPQQYGIVSAEFNSEDPTVIPQGESADIEYLVPNAGLVPVHVYLEPGSEGVDVQPSHVYVGSRGEATAIMTLHAPDQTGYYQRYLLEHRYLALLPESVITALYTVHQWLPIIVIDTILGGGMYLLGWLLIGSERVRVRRREDSGKPLTSQLADLLYGSK